ncbi:unnamed protein product [Ixodes pacificus]
MPSVERASAISRRRSHVNHCQGTRRFATAHRNRTQNVTAWYASTSKRPEAHGHTPPNATNKQDRDSSYALRRRVYLGIIFTRSEGSSSHSSLLATRPARDPRKVCLKIPHFFP